MKTARYAVSRRPDGKISYIGIDNSKPGTPIAENEQVLVIKWPAGKHWVARGRPPAYHPSRTDVLRKDEDGRFTLLISWEADRKKPPPARAE